MTTLTEVNWSKKQNEARMIDQMSCDAARDWMEQQIHAYEHALNDMKVAALRFGRAALDRRGGVSTKEGTPVECLARFVQAGHNLQLNLRHDMIAHHSAAITASGRRLFDAGIIAT